MQVKIIRDEAERLVREHGAEAYEMVQVQLQEARRHRNGRREKYLNKVALEISRFVGQRPAAKTVTRDVEQSA